MPPFNIPSDLSKVLRRQIKHSLLPDQSLDLYALLEKIDETYGINDQEQYCYNQSLSMLSQEMSQMTMELRQQTEDLKNSESRYVLASKATHDGLWDWDITKNKCFYSDRWKEIIGFMPQDSFDSIDAWLERITPEHYKAVKGAFFRHLDGFSERFEVEYQIQTREGKYLWVLTHGIAERDETGKAIRVAGSQTDISGRKKQEEQLYKAAFHDKLTGLPNRALFTDRVKQTLKSFKRGPRPHAALMFLDLDRFKIINDSLGHEAGDQLLVSVARRLEVIMRSSDTICRLGGDEFTLLLSEIDNDAHAKTIADRIIEEISKPYFIYGQQLYISGSIGIVIIKEYDTAENIMRNADLAMYQAKHKGKSCSEVFENKQYEKVYTRLQVETDLRVALTRQEFVPFFQPIVNLKTGQVEELEVLIRWQHPQRGLIPPLDFIPLAEETGLISEISEYLFHVVCKQMKLWSKSHGSHWAPAVALNLSVKQLFNEPHLKRMMDIFKQFGLTAGNVKFEVTESVIMEDATKALDRLTMLKDHGFSLAIDDFGTGYSSLSYIMKYPFDVLKIDRTFIKDIDKDSKKQNLMKAMMNLARDLGLKTVGEGVERWEEIQTIQELGCGYAQGFYFSRPLPMLEILELLCSGDEKKSDDT